MNSVSVFLYSTQLSKLRKLSC